MNSKHKEKVWLNSKTNFFYIQRGIDRTPAGSEVEIVECNTGIQTSVGTLKGTIAYGLRNTRGQFIAYSYDTDDLVMFAVEHQWWMDNPVYDQLIK
jgi:hypothetical protein